MAHWSVSSAKPSCGVKALRDPSPSLYWQSDGPQPHELNIHFYKQVPISHIRMLLDIGQDESYTPTKMEFLAGTSYYDLIPFHKCTLDRPDGWIDVDLSRAGGPTLEEDEALERGLQRRDAKERKPLLSDEEERLLPQPDKQFLRTQRSTGLGPTLRCWLVQIRIIENHQNGKDTHLRGVQIFSREGAPVQAQAPASASTFTTTSSAPSSNVSKEKPKGKAVSRADRTLGVPDDFFGEPTLR